MIQEAAKEAATAGPDGAVMIIKWYKGKSVVDLAAKPILWTLGKKLNPVFRAGWTTSMGFPRDRMGTPPGPGWASPPCQWCPRTTGSCPTAQGRAPTPGPLSVCAMDR